MNIRELAQEEALGTFLTDIPEMPFKDILEKLWADECPEGMVIWEQVENVPLDVLAEMLDTQAAHNYRLFKRIAKGEFKDE